MHPCPDNWLSIGRAVVYYARLPTHLVQELNVATVQVVCESNIIIHQSNHLLSLEFRKIIERFYKQLKKYFNNDGKEKLNSGLMRKV